MSDQLEPKPEVPPEAPKEDAARGVCASEVWLVFAIGLAVVCLLRWDAIRLPFYWDELGFYAPFARTMYEKGFLHIDPQLQPLFLIHPPFFYACVAGAAKLFGWNLGLFRGISFVSMAAYLTGAYWLARRWVRAETAGVMALALLLAPVSVSEAGMLHADLPAAALGLVALALASRGRMRWASLAFSCGVLTNVPLIFAAPAFVPFLLERGHGPGKRSRVRRLLPAAAAFFAPAAIGVAAWYFWLHAIVGAGGTTLPGNSHLMFSFLDGPLFLVKRFAHRVWQIFFVDGRWALAVAAASALALGSVSWQEVLADRAAQALAVLLASETVCLALFGATHQRYAELAIAALFVLGAWSFERLSRKTDKRQSAPSKNFLAAVLLALVAGAGITSWFDPPNKYSAPEYRSAYRSEVALMQDLADRVVVRARELGGARALVLARWPLSAALERPFLFYTGAPLNVARIDDLLPPDGKPGDLQALLKSNPGPKFLITLDHEADISPELSAEIQKLRNTVFAGGCTIQSEGEAKAQFCEATAERR